MVQRKSMKTWIPGPTPAFAREGAWPACLVLAAGLACLALPAYGQAPASPTEPPPAPPAGKPPVSIGPEGFLLQSADGEYQVRLRGVVQADGRFYLEDGGKSTDTFVLRRVRPVIEGRLTRFVEFRIVPDFGGGKVALQDASIEVRPLDEIRLRVGKLKSPVGLERLQSATALAFAERSLATDLVPNRDLGAVLTGDVLGGFFHYSVGVFNGVADNGSNDLDFDDSKDVEGRVFLRPFKTLGIPALDRLGLGVSGTWGTRKASPKSPNLPTFLSAGQQAFFVYRADGTGTAPQDTVFADGVQWRVSPQLSYHGGPVGLLGEYVRSVQSVTKGTESRTLTHQAWQVTVTGVVYGGDASYAGVKPARPVGTPGGAGAFELAARYSELRVDEDAFPTFADPAKSAARARHFGAGLSWYPTRNYRWVLDYDRTDYGAAPGGKALASENVLVTRIQAGW